MKITRTHPVLRDTLWGAITISAAILIFLSTPLSKIQDHVYSGADMTQIFVLSSLTQNYRPQNTLYFDTFEQHEPWLMFNREMLSQGKIPLWNPYNANGVPHLANYQSAVFSIFSLPFYVLPFKWALLLSAFMKLFGIGFFTFLFLKELGLRQIPALLGGFAFMFAGHNIVWLDWINAGVTVMLPACLFFAERIFSRVEHASIHMFHVSEPVIVASLVGFCASLLVGLLTGQPETFYFCFLLIALYVLFRLIGLWRGARFGRAALWKVLRLAVYFSAVGLLAAGLAAIQILPFLEYLSNSPNEHRGPIWQSAASSDWWPLSLYPNLLGSPGDARTINLIGRVYNYNEINDAYLNGMCLFLSVTGVLFFRGNQYRRYFAFFGGVALVWLIYAGNLFGLKSIFNIIPGVSFSFYGRSVPIWLFALSCCAAFTLNHLLEFTGKVRRALPRALMTAALGLTLLSIGAYGAYQFVRKYSPAGYDADAILSHADVLTTHITTITVSCGIGIAVVALLWIARHNWLRSGLAGTALFIVFFQSGMLLKDYNPTSEDRFFYPVTPAIQEIQKSTAGQQLLVMSNHLLPPDLNMVYKLAITGSYDAVDVQYYDRLSSRMFDTTWPEHGVNRVNELGLKLFGIDSIITYELDTYNGMFTLVTTGPGYALMKYNNALSKYHAVVNAVFTHSDEESLAFLEQPGLDLSKTVIIQSHTAAQSNLVGTVQDEPNTLKIVSEAATRIVLDAGGRVQPGYVVLAKTYYPGWKATVNGIPQPVYRANYAFSAIPLQPGDNHIEFYYAPDSFKTGTIISLASMITGLVLIVFTRRYQKRPTTSA